MSDLQTKINYAYQLFFVLGVSTFTLATISTLSFFQNTTATFAYLMKTSSVLLIITQLLQLSAAPIPMWRKRLCLPAVISQALYFYVADSSVLLNTGELYVLGSIMYSLSQELKILAMILQQRNFSKILQNHKFRFFKYTFLALGSIVFLISTLIISLSSDKAQGRINAGMVNSLSGIIFALSIVMLFKKQKYLNYKQFEAQMDSPRIIDTP